MIFIQHNFSINFVLVKNITGEGGASGENMKLWLTFCLGLKASPIGRVPVIATTSSKVGVTMPHFSWKVLVEPSQKYNATIRMFGLYVGPLLDN